MLRSVLSRAIAHPRLRPVRPPPALSLFRLLTLAIGPAVLPVFATFPLLPPPDPALGWSVLLPQALQRSPEYLELAARDAEARAQVAAARSWLAGRPSLEASYLDDRLRSDTGMSELEYAVQLPLRRPGERRDAAELGRTFDRHAAAWRASLELAVAGRLRETLADLAAAERTVMLDRQATAEARELVALLDRLFAEGDASAQDLAQARAALLAQERQELAAETALVQARAAYTRLTGLASHPALPLRETLSTRNSVPEDHPWLQSLALDAQLAAGQVKSARAEALGQPALLLGGRRQRGAAGDPALDSLLFGLSVPFGGSGPVGLAVAGAQRRRAESDAALRRAGQELALRLDGIAAELARIDRALDLAAAQAALERRHGEAARTAFELGETDLYPVLGALQRSRAATREHELLALHRDRLVARFNQTVGLLP